MKIAIIGSTGWIGSTIATEALTRGHEVIGIARDVNKLHPLITYKRSFDFDNNDSLANAIDGADVVVASVSGRAANNHATITKAAERLLRELPSTSVNRLVWVGGAGSLEVAPGELLVNSDAFPDEYKAEASFQVKALEIFRSTGSDVDWTFISPAAEIFPGVRTGKYRLGGDLLLTNEEGLSRISVEDYAFAFVNEIEKHAYPKQRIGVAY